MPQTILTGSTLAAGLRDEFMNTWRNEYDGVIRELGDLMHVDIPQETLTATFAYRESLPQPRLWTRGDPAPKSGLGSKSYSITAYDYSMGLTWHRNDRHDNRIGDLYGDAQGLAKTFARVPSLGAIDLLTATASFIAEVPNAPDGNALIYSSTRFGRAGGNQYTGTGVAATATITADLFGAMGAFQTFTDTAGKLIFPPGLEESYTIYAPVGLQQLMTATFAANLSHSVVSSTGAAVNNVVLASGVKLKVVYTGFLTGNSWYILRNGAPVKPLVCTTLEKLRETISTEDNSDTARNTGEESVQFTERRGFGVNMPYMLIKVYNA